MGTIFLVIVSIFIVIINYFRWVFSEYTETNAASLIPLDTILAEICAFIIVFSCTVWTKMRPLAGSLAYGVLADAFLIPPRPPILPPSTKRVRGIGVVTKVLEKRRDVGMAKGFYKIY